MNQETGKRQDRQIIQNDLEYADEKQLFIEEPHMDKCAKESETMT